MSITITIEGGSNSDLELNLTGSNFVALWHFLGLEAHESGAVKAQEIINRLKNVKAKLSHLTADAEQEGERFFFGGRTKEQVARYYWQLNRIASEAARSEKRLVWM